MTATLSPVRTSSNTSIKKEQQTSSSPAPSTPKSRRKSTSRSSPATATSSSSPTTPSTSRTSTAPADLSSIQALFAPHVQSFNSVFAPGGLLEVAIASLPVVSLDANPARKLPSFRVGIESVSVGFPSRGDDSADTRVWPSECRELGTSYTAPLMVTYWRQVADGPVEKLTKRMGNLPVMVRSNRCHLQHATPAELVRRHEEANEQGGFFIVNGNDRLIRLLIVPRRHYVTAVIRPSFTNRGTDYTKFAVQVRCVRPDQSSKTLTLHYLASGGATLRFSLRKQEFFVPALLVLKALKDTTDREIYDRLVQGRTENAWLTDRVELMLRTGLSSVQSLHSRKEILAYLGKNFRIMSRVEPSVSDEDVGRLILHDQLFVHCVGGSEEANNRQKFDLLVHTMQKLYALVQGEIKPDNPDCLACQEILLPGHLYGMLLKERLEDSLYGIKQQIQLDLRLHASKVDLTSERYFRTVLDQQKDIGKAMHYFLVTGNLISPSGLDLMQTSGFTIVAEKLNYFRYISHYRSVHRGQFFTTMKTTDVRKLLPESFGFFCPAHTPDGAPCGLLNHLTSQAIVLTDPCPLPARQLTATLVELGLQTTADHPLLSWQHVPVLLDGIVVGRVHPAMAAEFVERLRWLKVSGHDSVYEYLEIYSILSTADLLFPAIHLYTSPARVMRPVRYLGSSAAGSPVEYIGAQEQIAMEIAIVDSDYRDGETTHQELTPTNMLSVVASMTPFSDFNQSPRNMYQCQMGKQTMGTPFHSFLHRVDNKVFRIQNPQSPIVHNENYLRYQVDEYPLGTNAVVAVLAYTGYDMEDAMIINKGAYDRGFKHGSVYKYKQVDLGERRKRGEGITQRFSNIHPLQSAPRRKGEVEAKSAGGLVLASPALDLDGLPSVGQRIRKNDPLYAVVDDTEKRVKVVPHKEDEECVIDDVRVLGDASEGQLQKVGIKLRFNRNPVIGDKFASRAGQKGVMSTLYPQENMPFTESGMTPDIIINPHAFPSRMTIGMLIESMAGKSGSLHGKKQNSTPFQFSEQHRAVDYFGEELVKAGYSYVGTEPMYSGVTGEECRADVFIGVVYYQRLRHMVSDKAQVRATGPVNRITRQPIKGRKVHGGIRFGEMERDSLLGHGTAFLLHDRLMNSSDYSTGSVCMRCNSLLSTLPVRVGGAVSDTSALAGGGGVGRSRVEVICRFCGQGDQCTTIAIPYVFFYLANELAAMGIRMNLHVK